MPSTKHKAKVRRGRPRVYVDDAQRHQVNRFRVAARAAGAKDLCGPFSGDVAAELAKRREELARRIAALGDEEAREAAAADRARAMLPAGKDSFVRDPDLVELAAAFPNLADGMQYGRDVLTGRQDVCKLVRQACRRNERDMERIGDPDFPYVIDAHRAERAMRCVQMFREVKGPTSGQRIKLTPWQKFAMSCAFGWVHAETRARRFRYVLLYVPRGNGKTTLAAPIGLYMLILDGEGGAEVYSAAVTRGQARISFDMAQVMARRDSEFLRRYGVLVGAHAISQESSASTFRPLSRDAQALDGLNVHCAVLDELAAHKSREVHDVLLTATGKRHQSMMLAITTAGSNQSSIGYEQWRYAERVLAGEVEDDSFFALIYTIDRGDDWTDPKVWRKANPNWGVSVMPDVIERLAKRAMDVAAQQNAFKQKHLNVWTHADVAWMNMSAWEACIDKELREDDFEGEECIIGLDLAAKVDLAAKAKIFRRDIDGIDHYYCFVRFYVPQATIDRGINDSYATWQDQGFIHAFPGEVNDLQAIEDEVRADASRHSIVDVAYDPWQALQMANSLSRDDVPVIEVRPTVANFSPAMKELDALVRQRRFHFDGNPVLTWNVSCVRVFEDMKGNIFPRKDKNDATVKIDGLVAILMAVARRLALDAASDAEPSITILSGPDARGNPMPAQGA